MRTLHFSILAATALAMTGCNQIRLADSVDLTFDWNPLRNHDQLHMPYVAGASFDLYAIGVDEDDTTGWTIDSADPSVIRVDSTADGDANVTAIGAGTTAVTIVDDAGREVHEIGLVVHEANRAELSAHGPLIIDRPELQEDWSEIHVVAGGEATFEITWFDGDQQLFGNGALSAVVEGDIEVTPRRTYLFEDREWVTFHPLSEGTYSVQLLANGHPVRTVTVVAVSPDVVADIEIYGMDESRAHEGDLLTVLAQAYDAEGNTVFGAEYGWDLDGETQDGYGDLYRYSYVPDAYRMLSAHFAAHAANAMIHANEGFVDSTNNLGCSVGGVGMPAAAGSIAPLLVALAALRMRRRRAG